MGFSEKHVNSTPRLNIVLRSERLGHLRKIPPSFQLFIFIPSIVFTHLKYHILPLLEWNTQSDAETYSQGMLHFFMVMIPVFLLYVSYLRAMFSCPGYVPDKSEWTDDLEQADGEVQTLVPQAYELKQNGERRRCQKCPVPKYKPDRAHHCRICQTCVLRMDHHCPWIYNCVGYHNHKYFFLLLFYCSISCAAVALTMWDTFIETVNPRYDASPYDQMAVMFCEIFSMAGGIAFGLFALFHAYLIMRGMTTIDHMEKVGFFEHSPWNVGMRRNIDAVLGPNMAFWLLPFSPPTGNGTNFLQRAKES